jgi:hypothetical protein
MTTPTQPAPPTAPPLFSLEIDPRDRLLLFDIADDETYVAMEIQGFNDAVHGLGLLVLLARHDGTVDIYRQPGLRLEREPFSIGRGIGEWRETEIDPARLSIHPDGVDVEIGLVDAGGRRIAVRIDDRDGTPRRRATLLAPVGSGVADPRQFFVVLMRDFDLGRTSGIEPRLTIDGEPRGVRPFPGPTWLHHRRFIRYSADPVIAILNPDRDGPVDARSLGPLSSIDARDGTTTATLRLLPVIPDLAELHTGETASGEWYLDVADEPALTGGDWTARRTDDVVDIALVVTRPWRPRGLPWSLRLVTTLARVFRDWPTTYRWDARIDLATDPPHLRSAWSRTTGPDSTNPYRVRRLPVRLVAAVSAVVGTALVARRLVMRQRTRP